MAEIRNGNLYIAEEPIALKSASLKEIAECTLEFIKCEDPDKKEAVLKNIGYGESIGHSGADVNSMSPEQYLEHLNTAMLLSVLANEHKQPGFLSFLSYPCSARIIRYFRGYSSVG